MCLIRLSFPPGLCALWDLRGPGLPGVGASLRFEAFLDLLLAALVAVSLRERGGDMGTVLFQCAAQAGRAVVMIAYPALLRALSSRLSWYRFRALNKVFLDLNVGFRRPGILSHRCFKRLL